MVAGNRERSSFFSLFIVWSFPIISETKEEGKKMPMMQCFNISFRKNKQYGV